MRIGALRFEVNLRRVPLAKDCFEQNTIQFCYLSIFTHSQQYKSHIVVYKDKATA